LLKEVKKDLVQQKQDVERSIDASSNKIKEKL